MNLTKAVILPSSIICYNKAGMRNWIFFKFFFYSLHPNHAIIADHVVRARVMGNDEADRVTRS